MEKALNIAQVEVSTNVAGCPAKARVTEELSLERLSDLRTGIRTGEPDPVPRSNWWS
jgi:hypothetical protein